MLHVRFYLDKTIDVDVLSPFVYDLEHKSLNSENLFFLDDDVLVFFSNATFFEYSYELINSVIKELDKYSVYSEVLSLMLT